MNCFKVLTCTLMFMVSYIAGYESNYQKWSSSQDVRNNIQKTYNNANLSNTAWLGILDPLDIWLTSYTTDPVIQQFTEQGITGRIAQGMNSLYIANPARINNIVANLIGTPTPKTSIAKIIVDSYYNGGYANTIVDGATNILTSSWNNDNTQYDMVTMMAVMSDISETSTNPNGFFVYDSQTKTTIANLAYASQVILTNGTAFLLRQPIVFNAATDTSQEYYNFAGMWNYSSVSSPIDVWGYTLNVPVGAAVFTPIDIDVILTNAIFNITTLSGKQRTASNTTIFGSSISSIKDCQRSTSVNTHIYNPSAMGTGLWAPNGFNGLFSSCVLYSDYVKAVHGEGSICVDDTYVVYTNTTDGLLSFIIPSLTTGNWVVKPANNLLMEATKGNNSALKCIDSLRGPSNSVLNLGEPPRSPIYITQFGNVCSSYAVFDDAATGLQKDVIIEYAGPNARFTPSDPINDYLELQTCINSSNIPGKACFDPGLSRTIVGMCKQNFSNELGSIAYKTILDNALLLQQQTATQIVQQSVSSYIPSIIGAPTAYGAITALVAAGAAIIALDAIKILGRIQNTSFTSKLSSRIQKSITLYIMIFTAAFSQLPLVILCIQAFKLNKSTGYQYTPGYITATDTGNNNVYLILQVSATRLTYSTPLLWLYPAVLGISCIFSLFLIAIAYTPASKVP